MAILNIPDLNQQITDAAYIRDFLSARNIWFDQWTIDVVISPEADQDAVLLAYQSVLEPYMKKNGYKTADVISINSQTPNYPALRDKFLSEHRHSEDEVRFFVDGTGCFWFNLDNGQDPVFNVLCEAGDLIAVPAHTRHWFDAGKENPHVKAIRMFSDQSGWVPQYTGSGVDQQYNP